MAPLLVGLKDTLSIMGSGDVVAWLQFIEQNHAARLPAGIRVFIEETVESFHRIRPQGTINSAWTDAYYITCPK